jgi:hypothetical protein
MKTIRGPGLFLAQFVGDRPPAASMTMRQSCSATPLARKERSGRARSRSAWPAGCRSVKAFANLYREAADAIVALRTGDWTLGALPTAQDGLRGLAFITACLRSSGEGGSWVGI